MKELDFKVTVDEANLVLEGLGHLPFFKVYALVEKLQLQARGQLQTPSQVAGGGVATKVAGSFSDGDERGE